MPLPRLLISLFAAVCLGSGCIDLPEVDSSQQEDAGVPSSPTDSGQATSDGGDSPDASAPTTLTVNMLAPGETVLTNDLVDIQVQVTGGTPEKVELLVDDQLLTSLTAPYTYQWSTRPAVEGTHRLVARAMLGNTTFTSEVREVVVDRTPPQVASRAPTPGAQDVWVRQPIEATFSEPLKASTLTGDSVRLTVGTTEVAATVSLSTDGKKLSVTPSTRILVPNTVQLTLSANLTDMAGNALSLPSDTWAWSLPKSFPLGDLSALAENTSAEKPHLQIDTQGNPLVIWREQATPSSSTSNIYTYQWSGSTWTMLGGALNQDPIQPTSAATATHQQQTVCVDTLNRPIAAWVQLDPTPEAQNINIHSKAWSNSTWEAVGTTLHRPPNDQYFAAALTMRIDTTNKPVIAWAQGGAAGSSINAWKLNSAGAWSSIGSPFESTSSQTISLALDNQNNPTLAWDDNTETVVHRWTGDSWIQLSKPGNPAQGVTKVFSPNILINRSNELFIAWSGTDSAESESFIHVQRWTESGWELLGGALRSAASKSPAGRPELALDGAGNLFVAWAGGPLISGGTHQLHIRRWNGSDWEIIGEPLATNQSLFSGPAEFSFKVDSSGTPYIAWSEKDAEGPQYIRVHRYNH